METENDFEELGMEVNGFHFAEPKTTVPMLMWNTLVVLLIWATVCGLLGLLAKVMWLLARLGWDLL